jgi:hypothetical protein
MDFALPRPTVATSRLATHAVAYTQARGGDGKLTGVGRIAQVASERNLHSAADAEAVD